MEIASRTGAMLIPASTGRRCGNHPSSSARSRSVTAASDPSHRTSKAPRTLLTHDGRHMVVDAGHAFSSSVPAERAWAFKEAIASLKVVVTQCADAYRRLRLHRRDARPARGARGRDSARGLARQKRGTSRSTSTRCTGCRTTCSDPRLTPVRPGPGSAHRGTGVDLSDVDTWLAIETLFVGALCFGVRTLYNVWR